jgi:hypothetical protein
MPKTRDFKGKVKVASSIVDYLSSGLYESPAACVKELVNNSFDADASRVDIHVKPDAERIIVSDDGTGMSEKEFRDHFDHVSESHKRDDGELTKGGRPKVGRIGIGFIAANELCEEMEVVSTKEGSTELLRVIVDFKKMRDPLKQRRDKDGNVVKGDYHGTTVTEAPSEDHYTRIYLNEVREPVRDVMVGAEPSANTAGAGSLYGMGPERIRDRLADPGLRTWTDLNLYSQTMLKVGLNVPVKYAPDWIPPRLGQRLKDLEGELEELKFALFWDGTDVRKPVVLGHDEGKLPHVLRRFDFEGQEVSAKGYFFAQHGIIQPQELNGLLIRIRNTAVGEYDSSFLGFRASEYQIVKRWVSGEVWASNELEEALNIDRRTLREAHPAFVELQAGVHRELKAFFREARKKLYDAPSTERKATRAREQVERIEEIAAEYNVPPPRLLPRDQSSAEIPVEKTRAMSKKYSASELYDLTLRVAEEELPRELFRKFAKALAKRISG